MPGEHTASHAGGLVGRPERRSGPPERRPGAGRFDLESAAVLVVVAGSAAGGAVAGCHPTGTPVVDPLYTALAAAAVAFAASRASRGWLLLAGVVAVVLSRGIMLVPAGGAIVAAFATTVFRRPPRLLGAAAGALAVQAALRWPPEAFHGLTAIVAVAALAPCVCSGVWHLRYRRWILVAAGALAVVAVIFVIPLGVGALQAHAEVSDGIISADGALGGLGEGSTTSTAANITTEASQLRLAARDFSAASGHVGGWVTAVSRLVPVAAQQRQALAVSTSVASRVATVAADEAGKVDVDALRYQDGRIDLAAVERLAGPVGTVNATLTHASAQLRPLRSAWLVSPIRSRLGRLDTEVTKASKQASLADQFVRDAPGILGADGTRHYFVAFLDPSESRGLGGLIGAYGELTVTDGRIRLTRSGTVGALDGYTGRRITGPADYLARYGSFDPQDYFQDLSYSPDMPTVSDVIAQMYPQSGGAHINGVLALDPQALASLLGVIGPIDVPGLGTLDSANAAAQLDVGQYAQLPGGSAQTLRRDYLQDALRLAFAKLTSSSLPAPQALAAALDPAVREGHLLFWSFDRQDQPLLRRVRLAGAFPTTEGGDLLAVTTQNGANNKIDAYLKRTVTDHVVYDPANGDTSATVTVTMHNEAPSSGLSPVVIGSYPGSGLPSGTNRTWLSVYSPLGLEGARLDGRQVPMASVPELGVSTYSAFVDIPAGGTETLTLDLTGHVDAGHDYRLAIRQQPMVLADPTRVSLSVTSGWRLEGSGVWRPGADEVQRWEARTRRT